MVLVYETKKNAIQFMNSVSLCFLFVFSLFSLYGSGKFILKCIYDLFVIVV